MKILDNVKQIYNNVFKKSNHLPQEKNESYYINYYVPDLLDTTWNGDKFYGSFSSTKNYNYVDYYTLRARSVQLFRENDYARGIIRRLLTNEINKGLNLESNPIAQLIGMTDDQAIEWAEDIELKWDLWGRDAYICDYNQLKNLGQLEIDIRQTALISGDCLVILRINRITGLPCIEVVDGAHIQTPLTYELRQGNYIKYGIEFNQQKRQVAYWIYTEKVGGG
ncbi:MAG TPA: phage portal protein, partial [Candidatus Lokiarchaeia archaeon]